jgi:hypothetical protein
VNALRPHRDAALFSGVAFDQREIDIAAIEIAAQIGALIRAHVESKSGARTRKTSR